jgi:hypothetical protein
MRSTFRKLTTGAALIALAATFSATPAAARPLLAAQDAGRSAAYRGGQRAVAEERWADAAREFGTLATAGGAEADAALYWLAYAESKRQNKREALEAIRRLRTGHPASAWLDDAEALELELRGARAVESSADRRDDRGQSDELKLYAVDALMQMEPAKAIPVLERILAGDQPERVKQRALFVLGQSDSPKAREILARTARSGEPLALRLEAVQSLGIAGEAADAAVLAELARDPATPIEVRARILEAYLIGDRKTELVAAARADAEPRLRMKAIELLGAMGASQELRTLWSSEKDPTVQRKLLEAFGLAGDVEMLARAVREAADPELRRKAIEGLAIADDDESSRVLESLYASSTDPGDKRKMLEAFMIQDDAATLVELFRAERDPELKKKIVQQLALLDDPAATELLLGLIEAKQ